MPALPEAASFFEAVPAPRASTVVFPSTANFMSVDPTFTVSESAETAETVPRVVFVPWAAAGTTDQAMSETAASIATTNRLISTSLWMNAGARRKSRYLTTQTFKLFHSHFGFHQGAVSSERNGMI